MTNQKRGSAKLFHAARKKWDPAHGADHPGGRPGKAAANRRAEARGELRPEDRGGRGDRGRGGDREGSAARPLRGAGRPERGAGRSEKPEGAPRGKKPGGRPVRGATGRRNKPGLHERPETNQRIEPEVRTIADPRATRLSRRPDLARTEAAEPGAPKERLLPGAMPLNPCVAAFQQLLKKGLSYPNTYEDRLEGQTLVKLRNKSVVIALGRDGGGLQLTAKLPRSGLSAVSKFSWAEGASHGLARKGWVTARFSPADALPLRMLLGWVEESHLAVTAPAPKPARPAP